MWVGGWVGESEVRDLHRLTLNSFLGVPPASPGLPCYKRRHSPEVHGIQWAGQELAVAAIVAGPTAFVVHAAACLQWVVHKGAGMQTQHMCRC